MTVGNAYMFSSTVSVKYNTTVLWELGMNPEPPPTHKCTHFLEMVPIKFANYLKAPMSIHSSPHPVTHDSLRHAKTAQGPHPTETKLLLTSLSPQSITRQSVGGLERWLKTPEDPSEASGTMWLAHEACNSSSMSHPPLAFSCMYTYKRNFLNVNDHECINFQYGLYTASLWGAGPHNTLIVPGFFWGACWTSKP